jgi:hypothetical protein
MIMKKVISICLIFSNIILAQSVIIEPNQLSKIKLSTNTSVDMLLTGDEASPSILGQRANGTIAAKTTILNGNRLFSLTGKGYNGTAFSSSFPAIIGFTATQNWSAAGHGTAIDFFTTKNGENLAANRMRIDHTGNVGLGITTPEAKFHLYQNTANLSATIRLENVLDNVSRSSYITHSPTGVTSISSLDSETFTMGSDQNINIQSNGIKFRNEAGVPQMTLSPTGNIGLGTAPTANAKLIVSSGPSGVNGGTATKAIFEDDTTHYVGVFSGDGTESGVGFGRPAFGAFSGGVIYDGGNNLNFRTNTNDTRMTVSSTGNVGIGVSPISKFHVANGLSGVGSAVIDNNKTLVVESSANTSLVFAAPGNEDLAINFFRATGTAAAIQFTTNNSLNFNDRNFISANGNVGIGNFTVTAPAAKLHVDGDYAFKKKKLLSGNGGHSDEPRLGASVISVATPANGGGGETLGGLSDGIDGLIVYIFPVQGTSITITNESTSSLAANRILTRNGTNLVLSNDGGATLVYDANVSRWRVVGVAN